MHWNLTTLAAVYGSLVSTFTVGWNVFRDFHDRARITLSAMLGHVVGDGDRRHVMAHSLLVQQAPERFSGLTPSLFLTITNTGRRPIMLTGWAVRTDKKETGHDNFIYPFDSLPKLLKEGDYVIEHTDDVKFFAESARGLYAWDSTGKQWGLSRRKLRGLIREGKQIDSRWK